MKKIKLHPLFIVYAGLLIVMNQIESLAIFLSCVFLHEFAHYYVAKKLGYTLDKMVIMPYGVCLNYQNNCFEENDEIKIAIAGPLLNLALAIICFALFWITPSIYQFVSVFCYANLITFTFNLLPCFPLDGGRVLVALLSKKISRKASVKISVIFNIIMSAILILIFFMGLFFKIINFNLIIISLFLFAGILEPNNATSYEYLKINNIGNFSENKCKNIKLICVDSRIKLYKLLRLFSKNKFNVIYIVHNQIDVKILTEIGVSKLFMKYAPTTQLSQIKEIFLS